MLAASVLKLAAAIPRLSAPICSTVSRVVEELTLSVTFPSMVLLLLSRFQCQNVQIVSHEYFG